MEEKKRRRETKASEFRGRDGREMKTTASTMATTFDASKCLRQFKNDGGDNSSNRVMVASFEDECVVPPKTSVVSSVLTHLHFHLLELLHGRHLFFGSFLRVFGRA